MTIALETERLVLRNFLVSDWEALHEIIALYAASEFAAYDQPWPTTPDEIKQITEWFASGDSFLAACLKNMGQCIGLVVVNREPEVEAQVYNLGYVFHFGHHGKGYATEACCALLDHAFIELRAQRVVSGTAAVNRPSCRLLERLGFEMTGEGTTSFQETEDGDPVEFLGYTFTLTREQWTSRKSWQCC
jgi:ribosomal-protein-alanine N-acetyltransferase